jgi:WD40 repeat protein
MSGSSISPSDPMMTRRVVYGQRNYLQFHPDGKSLLLGTDDDTVLQWPLKSSKPLAVLPMVLGGQASAGEVHPNGEEVTLASHYDDPPRAKDTGSGETRHCNLLKWNLKTGEVTRLLKGQTGGIGYYQYSPDRTKVMIVSNGHFGNTPQGMGFNSNLEGVVTIWDVSSGQKICQLADRARQYCPPPQWRPDGRAIFLAMAGSPPFGWYDAATGKVIERFVDNKTPFVTYARVTPDGKYVIAQPTFGDARLHIWNGETGELLGQTPAIRLDATHVPESISPDCRLLAFGVGRRVVVIDLASRQIVQRLTGHELEVRCVQFSPDGRYLLSGSDDKSAAIWDVATGKVAVVLKGSDHLNAVHNLAWSPDGAHVATRSADEVIRVWPVDLLPEFQKRMQRVLSPYERERYELRETPTAKE